MAIDPGSLPGDHPDLRTAHRPLLCGLGFIEGNDGFPIVTEVGSDFRLEVEAETDRLFFAPWKCLEPDEKDELADLLIRLRDEVAIGV